MIILDFSMMLHRAVHSCRDAIIENPQFVVHIVLSMALSVMDKFGASKKNPVYLAIDSSSWRKDYFEKNKSKFQNLKKESYKGNREKSDDIPWDKIYEAYNGVLDGLRKHSDIRVIQVEKAEADDIIAVIANEAKAKKELVYVISSDKDFMQLYDAEYVHIYDPMKKMFKMCDNVENFKKTHIICGDSVDNIPAIKDRVGEKTAVKMLKDLDVVLQTNPEMKARYEFNQNLIDFDFIPSEIIESIKAEFTKNDEHTYNSMNLLSVFSKYRLNKMTENVQKFKLKEFTITTKLTSTATTKQIERQSLEEFFS